MKHQQATPSLNYKNSLPVSEQFLSIQGEPRSIGTPSYFIRLQGCNLQCKWCDTKYASKTKKRDWMSVKKLDKIIKKLPKEVLVVFTGGEPLLWSKNINWLIENNKKRQFEIETNGTLINYIYDNVFYNISPKLDNSGNELAIRYKPDVLKYYNKYDNTLFKFVVCDEKDLKEVNLMVAVNGLKKEKIYIMPEGMTWKTYKANALKLVDKVIENNYKLAVRFQILLWGKKKLK